MMKLLKWFLLVSVILAFTAASYAGIPRSKDQPTLQKSSIYDNEKKIDVNNISAFVTNHGSFFWDLTTGEAGLEYPKGTGKQAVFAAGFWAGALVDGQIRTAIASYAEEYSPGPMNPDGTWANADDPKYRVYKINKDTKELVEQIGRDEILANRDYYSRDDESTPDLEEFTLLDYVEWPVDDGAPVDSLGNPLVFGDQTLWCVYNDADPAVHTYAAYGGATDPLGIEIQQTAFAFNRVGPLGNIVFLKFLVINKGGNLLEGTYFSIFVDVDLGDAMDDYVGYDADKSLGYCYNATNNDAQYGSSPPAVGFDFFKGVVNDEGQLLGITSFFKYINGSGLGTDPDTPTEVYYYMQGYEKDGSPVVDPITGEETKFKLTGDPVSGTGWLDSNPSDIRIMLNTGPFTFSPGDTQDVVLACIIGQGKDRLTSIQFMRYYDLEAQAAFDNNFDVPSPPPSPKVTAAVYDRKIVLSWDTRADLSKEPGGRGTFYTFQGYNVYQGESVAGPWKKIATFDKPDGVMVITDQVFNPALAAFEERIVQTGSDAGVRHYMEITKDYLLGGELVNGQRYFFAVTAYSFNPDVDYNKALETPIESINREDGIVPRKPVAGTSFDPVDVKAIPKDILGDAIVQTRVVDPDKITGDTYLLKVKKIYDEGLADSIVVWDLLNDTRQTTIFTNVTDFTGTDSLPLVDGFQAKIIGDPYEAIATTEVFEVRGDSFYNAFAFEDTTLAWYVSSASGSKAGLDYSPKALTLDDFEIRFTGDSTVCYNLGYLKMNTYLPFEVWNIGPTTYLNADTSFINTDDDVRLFCLIIDKDLSGGYSSGDPIFVTPVEFTSNEDAPNRLKDLNPDFKLSQCPIGNLTVFGEPPVGTVVRLIRSKPIQPGDTYEIRTVKPIVDDRTYAKENKLLKNIRVVPNPYFGQSLYEMSQFERVIKFMNLPAECTIRIFNLAGDLVRKLEKPYDPSNSILIWNLETDNELPVASGIYIYYIEAKGIGTTFGKIAVFMEEERLDVY